MTTTGLPTATQPRSAARDQASLPHWALDPAELLQQLKTTPGGLSSSEARRRLATYAPSIGSSRRRTASLGPLVSQFTSPIILILLVAAGLSLFLQDQTDAVIIVTIVLLSGLLGFWQERGARNAVEKLLATVSVKATVLRDGKPQAVPVAEVVPGDVVQLSAGAGIPGDCLILESTDLFVDEAALTGETFPVEKQPGRILADAPLARRTNSVFMGTHVVSGTAKIVVAATGTATEFGRISDRLRLRPPATDFERGVRSFGYLLAEVTLILVIAIFAINVYLSKPVLDSLLFSLALAVGLTPQLLPAIISVNLSHGARRMAQVKVIVKRLAAIENLGSMNVLCSDKTGTLTEGVIQVKSAVDVAGNESEKVLLYSYLNASYESGFFNPIDEAVRKHRQFDLSGYGKLDEVPYDFVRKRLSILVSTPPIAGGAGSPESLMVTKGALTSVLDVCAQAEMADGKLGGLETLRTSIEQKYAELSGQGFRTLGVAYKNLPSGALIDKDDETGMVFAGFLVLADPPKAGIEKTVQELKALGITLKIITGDNRLVAANVGSQLGIPNPRVLAGPELHTMSDAALFRQAPLADLFAEVEPNQKERIILALKKSGHVVGYMGDGINDASALHAADVGLSVDSAVDVAKEAADFVLLDKDLSVLVDGVRVGRETFANTLKYVFMATSANFGNMFSVAGSSLFLSFLPLLPKQILLTNLMTDFPEMTIATDRVDAELVERPQRWNVRFILSFMLVFGLISSIFDYLTFGLLLFVAKASTEEFRTGWFVESVISAALIVLVIRTRRSGFQSRPSRPLAIATLGVVIVTLALPLSPLAGLLGFTPLPIGVLGLVAVVIALYVATAEVAKGIFYRHVRMEGI